MTRLAQRPANGLEPFVYQVINEDGHTTLVDETVLIPLTRQNSASPLSLLVGLEVQEYRLFVERSALVAAFARVIRSGVGFRALLGSRVDLRPHQAFVAGTVVLDWRRRYVLADEVGLGKTIEAGLVIHDLLIRKPEARILVVCPGALTTQWLSELFSKFGGQLFTLLDLHEPITIRWRELNRAIVSTTLAGYRVTQQLQAIPWDMLVIDEVHHLLASPILYDLAQGLSRRTPAVLLLSAIPAHEREEELMRLLALLEPERYTAADSTERVRFAALYSLQTQLGRQLRLLTRRIDGFEQGQFTRDDVVGMAERILQLPAISDDRSLRNELEGLDSADLLATHQLRQFAHNVADRYRLNRRILRNRRQRLVEQSQMVAIERRALLASYAPDQLEIEAVDAVHDLLRAARDAGLDSEILAAFGRTLLQSTAFPRITSDLLLRLGRTQPKPINDRGRDLITMGHTVGYADWALYSEVLFWSVRSFVQTPLIDRALRLLQAWAGARGEKGRWARLLTLLKQKRLDTPGSKILIFAGFPGAASVVADGLREQFGTEAITEFRAEFDPDIKENNVARFRDEKDAWILVSDETGGEGRNFQFASELVHVDTPWSAARVEQRIGRLDRLGRERVRSDVLSNVLFSETSPEAGLIRCYHDGLGVYTQSISGIEFALRDVERKLIRTAIDAGQEGLENCVEEITDAARRERLSDDSEAVLDEASFERTAAAKFRHVSRSDQSEHALEEAFVAFFRSLSAGFGVQRRPDIGPGVWRFRPEETRYGALPVDDRGKDTLVGNHDGTFRRDMAQLRPRLQFFAVGNSLFDAVIRSLTRHPTGRVYAVECYDQLAEPWAGFEFVFSALPKVQILDRNIGLVNQAEAPFADVRPLHLFYGVEGDPALDTDRLLANRMRLTQSEEGVSWWDLGKRSSATLPKALEGADWQDTLIALHEKASTAAKLKFAEYLALSLTAEKERIEKLSNQAINDGALDESDALRLLLRAMTEWRIELDSIGFLSINSGLHSAAHR